MRNYRSPRNRPRIQSNHSQHTIISHIQELHSQIVSQNQIIENLKESEQALSEKVDLLEGKIAYTIDTNLSVFSNKLEQITQELEKNKLLFTIDEKLTQLPSSLEKIKQDITKEVKQHYLDDIEEVVKPIKPVKPVISDYAEDVM